MIRGIEETRGVELKSAYNAEDLADRLGLIKEIVAFAHAGGGEIHLGGALDLNERPLPTSFGPRDSSAMVLTPGPRPPPRNLLPSHRDP
jgi:hypothetical protein